LPGKNVVAKTMPKGAPYVGHTSVGLVDTDSKYFVVKGFYAENPDGHDFSRVPGRIRDDSQRIKKTNVSAFFFEISDQSFDLLQKQIKADSKVETAPKFDLETFNCTDYAIQRAQMVGIKLPDPQGSTKYMWSSFTGSNPNMFGNALEEYMLHQEMIADDQLRELLVTTGKHPSGQK
jgi:hypothetical protein